MMVRIMKGAVFALFKIFVMSIFITSAGFGRTNETALFEDHKANIRKGNTCYFCHEVEEIKELAHNPPWVDNHKTVAARKEMSCLKCHSYNFCADCHSFKQGLKPSEKNFSNIRPSYPHRGEWITRHSLEVRADAVKCYRCHTQQSCAECHRKMTSPHPGGWLTEHGDEARRNIGGCAACHEDGVDTVCISCHRTINLHPPGWTERHLEIDKKKDRPCVYCHQ